MKFFISAFSIIFLQISFALDDTQSPSPIDRNGQGKIERLNNVDKDLQNLYAAENEARKTLNEIQLQIQNQKNEILKLKEEKEFFEKSLSELKIEQKEMQKEISEHKRLIEQARTSLYGEEGKREKDSLLNMKAKF